MVDGLEGLQVVIEVAPPDLVLAHKDAIGPVHTYILRVQVRERYRVRGHERKSHLCGNQPVCRVLPCWLRRAVRNRQRHAIEQASRRWRGGRRDDAARTRRKILISTQVMPVDLYDPAGLWGDMSAEKSKRGLAVEINNGRAAMLGIFGFMAASKVDGSVPALSFIKPYAGDYMQPFEGNFDLFA